MTKAKKFINTMNRCAGHDPTALAVHLGGIATDGNYQHLRFDDGTVAIGINAPPDGTPIWITWPPNVALPQTDDIIDGEITVCVDVLLNKGKSIMTRMLHGRLVQETELRVWIDAARKAIGDRE